MLVTGSPRFPKVTTVPIVALLMLPMASDFITAVFYWFKDYLDQIWSGAFPSWRQRLYKSHKASSRQAALNSSLFPISQEKVSLDTMYVYIHVSVQDDHECR